MIEAIIGNAFKLQLAHLRDGRIFPFPVWEAYAVGNYDSLSETLQISELRWSTYEISPAVEATQRAKLSLAIYLLKGETFWDVTLCSLVDRYQCFEGTFHPHLQDLLRHSTMRSADFLFKVPYKISKKIISHLNWNR
jgi:hypothetical protein